MWTALSGRNVISTTMEPDAWLGTWDCNAHYGVSAFPPAFPSEDTNKVTWMKYPAARVGVLLKYNTS